MVIYLSLVLATGLFAICNLKAYVRVDSTLGQLDPKSNSILSQTMTSDSWLGQNFTSINQGSEFQTYTSIGQFWYAGGVSGEYIDVVADYYFGIGYLALGTANFYNYLPYDDNTLTAENLRCAIGDYRSGYDNTYAPEVTNFEVKLEFHSGAYLQYRYHIKFKYHQRIKAVSKSSTNMSCYFSAGTGKKFLQLQKEQIDIAYYNVNFNYSVSNDPNTELLNDINNNQKDTNKKLDDVNKNLTDDTPPDTTGLGNASGWLPAGPVDSILTLPLNVLNTIYTNLSKSCTAVTLPLPFVESSISLPCGDTIYSHVDGLSVLLNTIGLVLGSFLLYSYFIYLYNWVDKKVSLIESDREKWGAV